MRAFARLLAWRDLEGQDVELPPFPDGYIHYLRMDVSGMHPSLYWKTSRLDWEMATAIQANWRRGIEDAREDHKARHGTG